MSFVPRYTTYGVNARVHRERMIRRLGSGLPFYMASITGGPVDRDMRPSMGQLDRETGMAIRNGVLWGLVDYIVWSYETPIAWHVRDAYGERWVVSDARYSRTTSKHQSIIRSAIATLEG